MSRPGSDALRRAVNRRHLLYATTAMVGAAGAAAIAWPLIDQMNPDAAVRVAMDIVALELAEQQPGQMHRTRWHNMPVFVVKRTDAMLAALQEKALLERLVDPQSEKRQQPSYAKNWHRSLDPGVAVLIGVCTACRCTPTFFAEASPLVVAGGYICPCCASHYDAAGRAYAGPAQYNLPVPPYAVKNTRLRIGEKRNGDLFTFESIERI